MASITHLRWQRDAACLEHPQDWWFPNKDCKQSRQAKRICRGCLVRRECLLFAMGGNEDHGIWGGFGIREIDEFKATRCRSCRRRVPHEQVVGLAIAGAKQPWSCRACWYRNIADRRRT